MRFRFVLLFCILFFLVPSVFSAGVCELDKAIYHPGESATFFCSCSEKNEEDRVGYVVFQNDSVVLDSVLVSSGKCKGNLFGGSYVLGVGDGVGNVSFSLNSDGSGIPQDWDDVDDVRSDVFNVSGAHVSDCLIVDVTGNPNGYDIGTIGSVKFEVKDGVSGAGLVHASCQVDAYNVDGTPVLFEPYAAGESFRYSLSDGEIGFQHFFAESVWEVDSTYLFEFHCACLNDSVHGHECYDEDSGLRVGFRSCESDMLFTTGSVDYRNKGNILSVVFVSFVVLLFFVGLSLLSFRLSKGFSDTKLFWLGVVSAGLCVVELIFVVGILFVNEQGLNLDSLLGLHFYIMLLLSTLISVCCLLFVVMDIFTLEDKDKKW